MKKSSCLFIRIILCVLIAAIMLISLAACGDEVDEYKLISEAFADFLSVSYSHEFYSVEKCVDEDGTEYYYFEIKLTDSWTEKHGFGETGGIIAYDGNGYNEFVHKDILDYGTHRVLLRFNELRADGKCHEFTDEEIAILDERIEAILAEKAESTESVGSTAAPETSG